MKVLLLQPPVQDFYDTDVRLYPIGLCYLKATVRKFLPDVSVMVKDYHHGWGRRTLAVPSELAYLKDFYTWPDKGPFRTFYQYYHFGASFETIVEDVAREKPDIVGISLLFSPYYREGLEVAARLKRRTGATIIMGGSHVSAAPETVLSHPAVDFVIRGEGERALVEFLKMFSTGRHWESVPNLGYKENGKLIFNGISENYPLEELPPPDLSDLKPSQYLFNGKPMSFIITSRSCPHRCTFCSVHQTFGFRFRRRSTESVLAEILRRYKEGYRVFDFEDDNLTYYKEPMKDLCRRLIEVFRGRSVEFVAMNGISYLSLDKELLELMKAAGFTQLNLSLVSSDTTVLQTTKRPHTVKKYLETVRYASQLGFKIVSYQILGLPNETLESMIQTLAFATRLPVLLGASLFYLTPNSPIARSFPPPSADDIFKARLTAMAVETKHFQRRDLYTLFVTTRILNFLKGLKFKEPELDLDEALEVAYHHGQRHAIGAKLLERLLTHGSLEAYTPQGLKPLTNFDTKLFARVWKEAGKVATQQGRMIHLTSKRSSSFGLSDVDNGKCEGHLLQKSERV